MRRRVDRWQASNPAVLVSDPAAAQFHMEDAIADIEELAAKAESERQHGMALARAVRSLAMDVADPDRIVGVVQALRVYGAAQTGVPVAQKAAA